ncbi:MAG: RuBisCO large subunit C-terminal-like domain-containing protein [Roseitalea porphyridii]|jgi:ribulose-bisphosphate carboxylase large chain|uniref:RuBisCO large subunit C-terminal-like domain-containing protein n=1 Tax=Roseitalea porphyridii TaxID=1852022 RepID=UPI0032EF32A1
MAAEAERFTVTYRILADSASAAMRRAHDVALEQTVEIPGDIVPEGFIADEIVGQVGRAVMARRGVFDVTISYSPDSAGTELVQLLNVMFGNSSIQQGIKVVGFDPGPVIAERFAGPCFGIAGVRQRAGRPDGGLISPVIKPQGSTADQLAEIAYRCVAGGADIIKDDHGLADQPMAPFEERTEKVAAAVARANAELGTSALHFANITGRPDQLVERAFFAKKAGSGGVLLMPGLLGFEIVHQLACDPAFDLPIMTHPSFTGPFVLSPDTGFTHAMMYGVLQRLAGSDISVFPNVGGRFGFSAEECLSIAEACRDPKGHGKPILPSPGGGMSVERAADMVRMYGDDVVYLLGGSLLRAGDKIGEAVTAMREAVDAARAERETA